jgi:hypothetical protein
MNRFGCSPVIAPFYWQPTRDGLKGLAASSTATGAAAGASTGASIGSAVPIIGTAIGAIGGAIGGAIAGSLGKKDPEQYNFDQAVAMWQVNPNSVYNIGNKYLPLAGLFDLKLNNPKIPIYRRYGRMGEQKFVTDMVNLVYQAAQQGQITARDTPLTIMSNIVQPWIDSWGYGPMVDPHQDLIQRLIVGMIADYVSGNQTSWHAVGGDYPFGSLPAFSLPAAAAAVPAPAPVTSVNPVGSAPAPAASGRSLLTADGASIGVGTTAGLQTPSGDVFYFGAIMNPAGGDATIWHNNAPVVGSGATHMMLRGGQLYVSNSNNQWYQWTGTTFSQVATPPQALSPIAVTPPPPPAITPGLPAIPTTPVPAIYPSSPGVNPVGSGSVASVPASIPQVNVPSSTVATSATGQQVTQADLQALIGQLAAQGQTAQQAYANALQTLANNGVQATPQVQSAVQSAVQSTPAPATAGLSSSSAPVWAIGAGVLAVIFATARPGKAPRRRRKSR